MLASSQAVSPRLLAMEKERLDKGYIHWVPRYGGYEMLTRQYPHLADLEQETIKTDTVQCWYAVGDSFDYDLFVLNPHTKNEIVITRYDLCAFADIRGK